MTEWKIRAGADAVATLLPHRPPLLLVDRIESFTDEPHPTLRAGRAISIGEPIFEGHFPGLSLWPGIYTIEGMGQTCQLLLMWMAIVDGFSAHGNTPEEAVEALRGFDARARLAGVKRASTEALRTHLGDVRARIGLSAAVDVRFFDPVFAGDVLMYEARLTHVKDAVRRFEVQATVEGRPVARGTMTAALP